MSFAVAPDGTARWTDLVGHPGFLHLVTTAAGPDLGAYPPDAPEHAARMEALAASEGFAGLAWARQVHGGDVLRVEAPGFAGEADALWTDRPGLGVLGRSADCPLVLVAGPSRGGGRLAGMAHASWRSTVAGIVPALMEALLGAGIDPAATTALVAPSAGPCCYEVGEDVRAAALAACGAAAEAWFPDGARRPHFDLWRAARDTLLGAGLPDGSIRIAGVCTLCGTGFHSYRRDGVRAGRFGAAVATRP